MFYLTIITGEGHSSHKTFNDYRAASLSYDAWKEAPTTSFIQFGIDGGGGVLARFYGEVNPAGSVDIEFPDIADEKESQGTAPEGFLAKHGARFVDGHYEPLSFDIETCGNPFQEPGFLDKPFDEHQAELDLLDEQEREMDIIVFDGPYSIKPSAVNPNSWFVLHTKNEEFHEGPFAIKATAIERAHFLNREYNDTARNIRAI